MEQVATLLLGLFVLALILAAVTGGVDGVRRWVAAKFLGVGSA
ncbi:MAG TPA: hypothetical protein VN962_05390 [Polyangia bacterium]|nr:hypothetical protein [Polyangia bacterium]